MKIEKISDTQIRCTLNRADLISREIKISELAYGTEKAKNLFHDMIEQASSQFGFEADDIPLMVEAIPVSSDCIVLIITKVDDPEELDTRFSKFAPSSEDVDLSDNNASPFLDMLEDIVANSETDEPEMLDGSDSVSNDTADKSDSFIPISESIKDTSDKTDTPVSQASQEPIEVTKMFSFTNWAEASLAAQNVQASFEGSSKLYRNNSDSRYYLVITGLTDGNNAFFMICNILSEYGKREKFLYSSNGYLSEHCDLIIKEDAINILSKY